MTKPVFFIAFANSRDDYLPMINRERKNIQRILRRHEDDGAMKLESEASTTLEDLFEIFHNYGDQVALFHYGGHAGGETLLLEEADTSNRSVRGAGLAQLLGQQKNLKLVFLNGCATRQQVGQLLKNGVKAVIATSVEINDSMATEFAEQFYHSLASHSTLSRAFDIAKAFIVSKYKDFPEIGTFRGLGIEEEEEGFPWGLYVHEEAGDVMQWSLPKKATHDFVLRNRFSYETRVDVNDDLIDTMCEHVAQYNKDLDYELGKNELDIPSIKREIIDSFPTPIGEQLRRLFTRSNDPDRPDDMELFTPARLKQLALTYRVSVQFICFTLLSQLWDEKHKNPALKIGDDYAVDFNSFFTLNQENFEAFDYVSLIRTITNIFDDHKTPYFIDELKQVKIDAAFNQELYEAYVFMNNLHQELLDQAPDRDAVEGLCLEAEKNLGVILRELSFLVKYKLATIKNIELIKERHQLPRYRHSQILLNGALTVASTGTAEVGVVFNNFTDSKSVLFLKSQGSEIEEYLSLTPFVIDENALSNDYSSKLYTYSFQTEEGYAFQFLNNLIEPPLVVSKDNFSTIHFHFEKFKSDLFDIPFQSPGQVRHSAGGSRFSRKR